jgi:inorganic phosphate transporter, PiT family
LKHHSQRLNGIHRRVWRVSTGLLVILATKYGLAVSTRHVSVGSLFGIGLMARKANVGVVLGVVLAWLLTLPCAALISGVVYWLVGGADTV